MRVVVWPGKFHRPRISASLPTRRASKRKEKATSQSNPLYVPSVLQQLTNQTATRMLHMMAYMISASTCRRVLWASVNALPTVRRLMEVSVLVRACGCADILLSSHQNGI